jgi:hypothetical protein
MRMIVSNRRIVLFAAFGAIVFASQAVMAQQNSCAPELSEMGLCGHNDRIVNDVKGNRSRKWSGYCVGNIHETGIYQIARVYPTPHPEGVAGLERDLDEFASRSLKGTIKFDCHMTSSDRIEDSIALLREEQEERSRLIASGKTVVDLVVTDEVFKSTGR